MDKKYTRGRLKELKDIIVKCYYPNGCEKEEDFAWFDKDEDMLFIEWWLTASYEKDVEKGKYFLALSFSYGIDPIVCCNITKVIIEKGFNPEIVESFYVDMNDDLYFGLEGRDKRDYDMFRMKCNELLEERKNDYKRRSSETN